MMPVFTKFKPACGGNFSSYSGSASNLFHRIPFHSHFATKVESVNDDSIKIQNVATTSFISSELKEQLLQELQQSKRSKEHVFSSLPDYGSPSYDKIVDGILEDLKKQNNRA